MAGSIPKGARSCGYDGDARPLTDTHALFFSKPYASLPEGKGGRTLWNELSRPIHDYAGTPRISKVTMLYGEKINPYYVRALRSHRTHNERWNYGMNVLDQDLVGGYWNKPSYLISLIVGELAKKPDERVEWFMWVDADLVLVNPAIPLEVFLPPPDFSHINFLGTRDHKGLNSGTFFIRVCPWSIKMLAKSMGIPMFLPDLDLDVQVDQTSMAVVMNETAFHSEGQVLFQPRTWYNTFQFQGGSEWVTGDLLVHFPGLESERWGKMDDWLDKIEHTPEALATPLAESKYPAEIEAFWKTLRRATRTLAAANDMVNRAESDKVAVADLASAAEDVRHIIWSAALSTAPGTNLFEIYDEKLGRLDRLMGGA